MQLTEETTECRRWNAKDEMQYIELVKKMKVKLSFDIVTNIPTYSLGIFWEKVGLKNIPKNVKFSEFLFFLLNQIWKYYISLKYFREYDKHPFNQTLP